MYIADKKLTQTGEISTISAIPAGIYCCKAGKATLTAGSEVCERVNSANTVKPEQLLRLYCVIKRKIVALLNYQLLHFTNTCLFVVAFYKV